MHPTAHLRLDASGLDAAFRWAGRARYQVTGRSRGAVQPVRSGRSLYSHCPCAPPLAAWAIVRLVVVCWRLARRCAPSRFCFCAICALPAPGVRGAFLQCVAQPGSARDLGSRGRRFDSCRTDQFQHQRDSRPLALVSAGGLRLTRLHEVDPNMEVENHGKIKRPNWRTFWQAAYHRQVGPHGWQEYALGLCL